MLRAASVNAANSHGIFLPIPSSSEIFVLSGFDRNGAGDKEHRQLAQCMGGKGERCPDHRCNPPGIGDTGYPGGRSTAAPSTM